LEAGQGGSGRSEQPPHPFFLCGSGHAEGRSHGQAQGRGRGSEQGRGSGREQGRGRGRGQPQGRGREQHQGSVWGGNMQSAGRKPTSATLGRPNMHSLTRLWRNISPKHNNSPLNSLAGDNGQSGAATSRASVQTGADLQTGADSNQPAESRSDTDNNIPPEWIAENEAQFDDGADTVYLPSNPVRGQRVVTGFLKHTMNSLDAKNNDAAVKRVEKGDLWDRPSEVMHCTPSIDLKKCWRGFCKYRVFNWLPDAMMPCWKPRCCTCGSCNNIVKHGTNNPSRIVYGLFENYILNAPQRYKCTGCEKDNELEKTNGVLRKN
jgi:hypothetical protein